VQQVCQTRAGKEVPEMAQMKVAYGSRVGTKLAQPERSYRTVKLMAH
jgi:hypothetical protein